MIELGLIVFYLIGYVLAYRAIRKELTSNAWTEGDRIGALVLALTSWVGVITFNEDVLDWLNSKDKRANW